MKNVYYINLYMIILVNVKLQGTFVIIYIDGVLGIYIDTKWNLFRYS